MGLIMRSQWTRPGATARVVPLAMTVGGKKSTSTLWAAKGEMWTIARGPKQEREVKPRWVNDGYQHR